MESSDQAVNNRLTRTLTLFSKEAMEMKAPSWKLLGLALVVLLFQGFGPKPASAAYKVTILGGSAGGMWSVITEGVAESIRRGLPSGARITTEPGKDGPNQTMVNRSEVELAVGYEATAVAAIEGKEPYPAKHDNLVGVAVLSPIMPFQFFIDAKSGIKSFEDLAKNKYPLKVSPNRKGSMMEIVTRKVLEAHGASYDNIKKWGGKVEFLPANEALTIWNTGLLESAGEVAQYPLSAYVEFSMRNKLAVLPIRDEAVIKKLCDDLGMTTHTIPANTYSFQPEAVPTINTPLILLASKSLDPNMVYDIVKALHGNLGYLNNVHSALKTLNGKSMAQMKVPLHPGAAKFYKEAGILP
jgi:uncharacterized protein